MASAQAQVLQELFILATGRPAHAVNFAGLEFLTGPAGDMTAINNLINTYMGQQAQSLGTANVVKTVAQQGLGLTLTDTQANNIANDLNIGRSSWAGIFQALANSTASVTATLDNRGAAAVFFGDLINTQGKSALYNEAALTVAAANVLQSVGASALSLEAGKNALTQLAQNFSASGITSTVADGYIKSAAVFADANNNGKLDAGEWTGTTSDSGHYTLPRSVLPGTIIASGGIDIMTNLPFKGMLTAPAGSTIVNPFTTIVQTLVENGTVMTNAVSTIINTLNLPTTINPLTYDPLKVLANPASTTDSKAIAFDVQTKSLQLSNLITMGSNVINSASGTKGTLLLAGDAVTDALANAINGASTGSTKLDLTSSATLNGVLLNAATLNATTTGVTIGTTMLGQAATIIAANNIVADDALTITQLSQSAVVSQGAATDALITGAALGDLNLAGVNFTGANLKNAVLKADPGLIAPGVVVPKPEPVPSALFTLTETSLGSKVWTLSTENGNVVVTDNGTHYVFTPTTGTAVQILKADLTGVVVSSIALSGTAVVIATIPTITGGVTVTDAVNATQLKTINDATSGTLTLANTTGALSGTISNLLAALTGITGYTGTITVTDAVNATQLKTINDIATGTLVLDVKTGALSDTAANLTAALSGITSYSGTITVSDAVTAAQLKAINDASSGTLTLSNKTGALSGTAADLDAALTGITSYTGTITITDAASIAQLKAINTASDGSITLNSTGTALTGTAADLVAAFAGTITAYTGTLANNDAAGTTAPNVETMLTATTGAVTARLQNSYTTGSTFTVATGDVINIDPSGTVTALKSTAEASVGAVDAAGEWFYDSTSKLFSWYDSAATLVDSFTLTGIAEVEVGGDTVTIPSSAFAVSALGGGAYKITGGTGDITLTKPTTAFTFTPATGTPVTDVLASGVLTLAVPSGRQLITTAAILTGNAFTNITGDVTITDSFTGNGFAGVGTYTLQAASNLKLGAAGQNVTAGTAADTVNVAAWEITGTLNGGATGVNTLVVADGANLTAGTISNFSNLTFDATGVSGTNDLTLKAAQHALFSGTVTAAGTGANGENIIITDAFTGTGFAAVENYVLMGASTFTLGAAGQNVTAGTAADTVNVGTFIATGTLNGGAVGTNTLVVRDGANISGATISNFSQLTFDATGVTGTNDLTLTAAQHAAFSGTVTAVGTGANGERITFTNVFSGTGLAGVENYVLADVASNDFTLGADAQNVTGSTSQSDTVRTGARTTVSGTFALGGGTDVLVISTTGTNLSAATVTEVEQIQLANNVSATLTMAQNAKITTAGGTNAVTLSEATTGAHALSANVENYTLAAGANSVTSGAAGQSINADALTDGQVLTLAGTHDVIVSLVAGDLTSTSSGKLTVNATTGTNVITTGGGDDTIDGGSGADNITGGAGADSITGGIGADTLAGGDGDDIILADDTDSINGGDNDDSVFFAAAVSAANLADGDLLSVESLNISNTSDASYDFSAQTEDIGSINGNTGKDTITGGGGAENIGGSDGNDSLSGGGGDDTVRGEGGNDTIIGGLGSDDLRGDDDNDVLFGEEDDSQINGGDGTDTLRLAANFNDLGDAQIQDLETIELTVTGLIVSIADQTEGYTLTGFAGGASTITGGGGVDSIVGGTGNDDLKGGGSDDTIRGGTGSDTLAGGTGTDVYLYSSTSDGSTTPGSGDIILTGEFVSGTDDFFFDNAAFGSLGTGALTAAADTAFDTDEATTFTNLAAKADSEVYRATLTGATFDASFYDALDAAITGGTHTGAAFFVITNGTDSVILYDADTNATAAGSLVEIVKITGATTLTVATSDIAIV